MTRRAVLPSRVIPLPGCSAEVDTRMDFGPSGCSSSNFSKSVNSFGFAVFFRRFSRPMLSIGAAKSPNEFVTKALDWTKGWGHGPKIRNFVAKIDILLELKMHHSGKNTPGDGLPRVR